MSWLPWVEWYWNCCNPRFCFCLAQSLSRSSQFPASICESLACQFSLELEDMYLFLSGFPWETVKAHLDAIPSSGVPVFTALQFRSWSDELMRLGTAPAAFSPCIVGQYHVTKFGLIVLAFYPAVTTSRNTVKPGGNPRRASKWQTWKCMQVLYGIVCAYFTEERRQLLGSWEAADVQCMDPQTAVLLVTQLSSVTRWEQGVRPLVL